MQKIIKCEFFFSFILILLSSCSNQDYFSSIPISRATTIDANTYSYLASISDEFSLFVELIDSTESKELINSIGTTVIAPHNYSIERYVFESGKEKITEFSKADLFKLIKRYIIPIKVSSWDFIDTVHVNNLLGDKMLFEIKRDKWKGVDNIGPQYILINNLKNIEDDKDDIQVKVITPDIETSSGILHVLSKDHLFGF